MSDMAKDKAARMLKRRGSISSLSSHEVRAKEFLGKSKDSMSTVSYMDEPGHDIPRLAIRLENTYQLEIAPVGSEVSGEESQPAKPNLRSPLNPAYLYTRSIHPIGCTNRGSGEPSPVHHARHPTGGGEEGLGSCHPSAPQQAQARRAPPCCHLPLDRGD
ncbi:dynein light chain Tctex-type 5 isoform X3 [Carettochelys insculpta]|uniref:dynein light chain Tctex-type 5 isoform X3 n=1 Tax=Carettochelys insculpta TaxID=44489 RepID=UPI003EB95C9A